VNPRLKVKLGKLSLKNPVIVSSGCFGYGDELAQYIDITQLGGIITKSITLKPQVGTKQPRLIEGNGYLLNCIGLENIGIENFLTYKLPKLRTLLNDARLIVSIAGFLEEEYIELAKLLSKEELIDGIEVNISCPNIQESILFGQDKNLAYSLIKELRNTTDKLLIVKLTPNVKDIIEIATCVYNAGCDAISLINTVYGMHIDINTKRFITGGVSGPAIKPIALRCLYEVRNSLKTIPIIAGGGIVFWQDALEFILAGANAVSVGTANLIDPKITINIIQGLREYLISNNIKDINELCLLGTS
jgi:dihydroorotate dehydrogenase (NAD+) catalytic subunit